MIQLYSREEKNTLNNTKNNILPFLFGYIYVSSPSSPKKFQGIFWTTEPQFHWNLSVLWLKQAEQASNLMANSS